jgi:hypothetical protein
VPHVLHLVREPGNRLALDVLTEQARDPALTLSVVLWPGTAAPGSDLPGRLYRLEPGVHTVHDSVTPIGYRELLDLVFAADTVVTW